MVARMTGKPVDQNVIIRGREVLAISPEGQSASMKLEKFIEILSGFNGRANTGCVLPDGIKLTVSRGSLTIWVYERSPQVYSFKWIAKDSPRPFGRGTKYRTVRIALPYLVVLAVFEPGIRNSIQLSGFNECYFRRRPLKSTKDELFYPALLNCSKFDPPDGRPLSWICTAKLDYRHISKEPDNNKRMQTSLRALLHTLLETGYNRSSDYHEDSSWFTESTGIDPRISTIENWEKATAKDPLFVLDVPWLSTGLTLELIIERIFNNLGARRQRISSATDIKRILFNYGD
jgi:hypothetical protein